MAERRRISSTTLLWVLAAVCFTVFTVNNVSHLQQTEGSISSRMADEFHAKHLTTTQRQRRPDGARDGPTVVAGGPQTLPLPSKVRLTETSSAQALPLLKARLTTTSLSDHGPKTTTRRHTSSGLSCGAYGGPDEEAAVAEMVYWSDLPEDAAYTSPFYDPQAEERYLTFEPDGGGWNNIRMAMETVVAMAYAMGRTLVLPPEQKMYLLGKQTRDKQKVHFSFADFFHLDSLNAEHAGLKIIDMEEFLRRTAMQGTLVDKDTGEPSFPPNNRTDWHGMAMHEKDLYLYLRRVTHVENWKPGECLAAFPASTIDPGAVAGLHALMAEQQHRPRALDDRPVAVDAPAGERLGEARAGRRKLCVYDDVMRAAPVMHFMCYHKERARLLTHFYTFLFFEDWRQDVWTKRFVRDHFRYVDEIQCAAARVVREIRRQARERGDSDGAFDSLHVRRGDFQFKRTRVSAEELYALSKGDLTEGATVYVATDERDKSFFQPLREHYHLLFLDDFAHLFPGLNTNYYGMLDQLVASKGRVFYGTYWSTFTGYINRMRGYYVTKHRLPGYQNGTIESYYFLPEDERLGMKHYKAVNSMWSREFPVSWRDIDHPMITS